MDIFEKERHYNKYIIINQIKDFIMDSKDIKLLEYEPNYFIETYIDRDEIYKAELENKLSDFFGALKWEMASVESQTAKKFFEF